MPEILKEKIVFKDTLTLEEADLKDGKHTFKRMRVNREDGAAVLVYNTETNKVILTKQFRYAILKQAKEEIVEVLAGKVEKGLSPEETAVKETKEEIGYKIEKSALVHICSVFISPGYTSERLHLYYTEVTNAQHVAEGGGLEHENEDIQIVEMPLESFFQKLQSMELSDAKTVMAGQWLINKRSPRDIPSPH